LYEKEIKKEKKGLRGTIVVPTTEVCGTTTFMFNVLKSERTKVKEPLVA
jgi:hypothetical protein